MPLSDRRPVWPTTIPRWPAGRSASRRPRRSRSRQRDATRHPRRALERIEPFESDAAVRFSELCDRVGTTDSGQFNYHLERLTGQFVESTDDGYRLTATGRHVVQSVISGAGVDERRLDPQSVEMDCGLCGGDVTVAYEDGHVYVRCADCDGLWRGEGDSGGHLAKFTLDPAGLTDRTPGEIYAAAWVRSFRHLYSLIEGVCPACSGPAEGWLADCVDHADAGVCENCGRQPALVARFRCTVCKEWAQTTLGGVVKYRPRSSRSATGTA
jgi:hypothetical protein